jgi:hypothetical protein
MAELHSPTVIRPALPHSDITPLEQLVLSEMFEAHEEPGDTTYYCSSNGPVTTIYCTTERLREALLSSTENGSVLSSIVRGELNSDHPNGDGIFLDLSGISWECIFQDILRRSSTLSYITAITSFTCSKMRPDGFGGMVVLITSDAIHGKSTNDVLEELLGEMKLGEQ